MARKYDYLTKEIAYPIIARYYKNGGGLPSAFYNKEGLSECQFYTWRKRYLKDHPPTSFQSTPAIKEDKAVQPSFYPIRVSVGNQPEQSSRMELEYPNGVVLRVDESLNEVRLASLIKLY